MTQWLSGQVYRSILAGMDGWIAEAKAASSWRYIQADAFLLQGLHASEVLKFPVVERDHLVHFQIDAPEKFEGPKLRSMHQVDALATRLLELAGARIKLKASGGGNFFEYGLALKQLPRTTLGRILWGIPSGPTLVEDGSHDYVDYIPSNFEVRWGIDRNDVLIFVRDNSEGLDHKLHELFQIRDSWHSQYLITTRPRRKKWHP